MKKTFVRLYLERGCKCENQGNYRKAKHFFLIAARRDNVEAQVNLANLYDEGKGTQKSSLKAVYWYKRAIKLGSPEGAYNLGVHYINRGLRSSATRWFEKAAEMGDEDAKCKINACRAQLA